MKKWKLAATKKRRKASNSGVLITPHFRAFPGTLRSPFQCTTPTPGFHCIGLLSTDVSANLKEIQSLILPSSLSSFHGRHSVNICCLGEKKSMRAQEERLDWKMNLVSKPRVYKLTLEMWHIRKCPDLPWPPYLTGICLRLTCLLLIFCLWRFWGAQRWGVSGLTLGLEQRLEWNRTTILIFRENQGMKSLKVGFL